MSTRNKHSTSVKLGVSIIAMMVVILGSISVLRAYQDRTWDYEGRYNVLDVGQYLLTSYPSSSRESIVIVELPKDAYFLMPEGYGYYKLEDIIELSYVEGRQEELVLKSVSYSLGIPVEQSTDAIGFIDRIRIWRTKEEATKDPRLITLENEPIFTPVKRKDGVEIDQIDPNKVDRYLTDVFWETDIKEDPYTVGVFNASDYPGLATGIGRLLEHVGYRVVEISNWEGDIGTQCLIRYHGSQDIETSHSFNRLKRLLSCPVEHVSDDENRYTFEVVVTDAI